MDPELILPIIFRWAHIGCAIVLIGGSAFIWLVLQPALKDESSELHDRIRHRWKKFVHPGVVIFLLSGIYNLAKAVPNHQDDPIYLPLILIKMLLALVVFTLASILVGSKPGTQKIRDNARKWLGITLLLATVIVGISGFVKVRPWTVPVESTSPDVKMQED